MRKLNGWWAQLGFKSGITYLLVLRAETPGYLRAKLYEIIFTTNVSIYFIANIFISSLLILKSSMHACLHLDLYKNFKGFNFYQMIKTFVTFLYIETCFWLQWSPTAKNRNIYDVYTLFFTFHSIIKKIYTNFYHEI